jgi:hypothetical protein
METLHGGQTPDLKCLLARSPQIEQLYLGGGLRLSVCSIDVSIEGAAWLLSGHTMEQPL